MTHFSRPEDFGTPGTDDNALFLSAIGTGLPVLADGPVYQLNPMTLTAAAEITFGAGTVIENLQASGVKLPVFTFEGSAGTPVNVVSFDLINSGGTVTSLRLGQLSRVVTVSDASGFAPGDTVRIYEDGPAINSTRKGTTSVEPEDRNYREFATIDSIDGNVLTLREFLRWPYTVGLSMKVQKIAFVERPRLTGGIWTGGNTAGGAVAFKFCRDGYAGDLAVAGNSEADMMGGAPVYFADCWESERGPVKARWCLFTHYSSRNQACRFGAVVSGKRTTNGGVVVDGDILCHFAEFVQDAPGDDNGDQVGLSNGARRNTFAGLLGSGSACYTAWIRQGCDDNTFLAFSSFNGITVGIQDFADRNIYRGIKIHGHPSSGVRFAGDGTQAHVDIAVEGHAIQLDGNQFGLRITGTAICTGPSQYADLMIGANLRDSVIDIRGGVRGARYASGAIEHHSNEIIVSGQNPYQLLSRRFDGGVAFTTLVTGVTNTAPTTLKVPGYDLDSNGDPIITADGLVALKPNSGNTGIVYEIRLTRNQGYAGACSSYRVMSRQGEFVIMESVELANPSFPQFTPKLRVVSGTIEIYVDTSTASQIIVDIRKA